MDVLVHSLSGHSNIASPTLEVVRENLLHPPYRYHDKSDSACSHVSRLIASERQGCVANGVAVPEASFQIEADVTVVKLEAPLAPASGSVPARDVPAVSVESSVPAGVIVEVREVPVYFVGSLLDLYA